MIILDKLILVFLDITQLLKLNFRNKRWINVVRAYE